ncbi:hypothetical protein ABIE56_000236 [Luteibacter sp. 621]|uniref:hypothetical protein n=1 Tax=Luteibacter sp. 621 TaxID=3373916 RepID=UPI003D2043EB
MTFQTMRDVVSNPMGTARLLEGFSTLRRAAQAGITPGQLRVLYQDLARCSEADVQGFMRVGELLVAGELRLRGQAFGEGGEPVSA